MDRPLALTPGEPAGIGPDLTVTLAATARTLPWVAVADCAMLAERSAQLGMRVHIEAWQPGDPVLMQANTLSCLDAPLVATAIPGQLDAGNAQSVLHALNRAVDGCVDGTFRALVTGPMQKSIINEAGIPFTGHTEHLAARTGGEPVMMLVANSLRVALATIHLPLRAVPDHISEHGLLSVLRVLDRDLSGRFGIANPRITVLGLNPHAGEFGHLGREEIDIIIPVLERLRAEGLSLRGPLPADTAFTPAVVAQTDAFLAMYHDQGLPVLKYAGFGHAVNCTLGLPIVRTSVDHGTALDLAGTGHADPGSLSAALALAGQLA